MQSDEESIPSTHTQTEAKKKVKEKKTKNGGKKPLASVEQKTR
jgi:hypothetical protein